MPEIILKDHVQGRSIFHRVIPTVNTLGNLMTRMDANEWEITALKAWEKPIYNAYKLEAIKSVLKVHGEKNQRGKVIKDHLLRLNADDLGPHPLCVYLVAFFAASQIEFTSQKFHEFMIANGVTEKQGSSTAIWQVGINDGIFLDLIERDGTIKDDNFFKKWADCENPRLTKIKGSTTKIKTPIVRQSIKMQDKTELLDYFIALPDEENVFVGTNSFSWANDVLVGSTVISEKLNVRFYRDELLMYCADITTDDLNALLAILSWGGMHREHAAKLLKNIEPVLDIVTKLRCKTFKNRAQAFEYIQAQRAANLLPGMGIGYFTKLICFLHPELNGYIMDQWLAKSINLLSGYKVVDVDSNGWVTDRNGADVYELFCDFVDQLGIRLQRSGFKTEEKLFSRGGKNKGIWRQYVVENYKH